MHLRRILRLAAGTRPPCCGSNQLGSVHFFVVLSCFFSFSKCLRLEAEFAAAARTPAHPYFAIFSNLVNAASRLRRS
jgi:hypothetical protein